MIETWHVNYREDIEKGPTQLRHFMSEGAALEFEEYCILKGWIASKPFFFHGKDVVYTQLSSLYERRE